MYQHRNLQKTVLYSISKDMSLSRQYNDCKSFQTVQKHDWR